MRAVPDICQLLDQARAGDSVAWHHLVDLVYPELKRLARSSLGNGRRHTLGTTALVHECYLRLVRVEGAPSDRGHLLSLAVRIMRQVLVDHARERLAQKRGGGAVAVSLDELNLPNRQQLELLVDLDNALNRLAEIEPRKAQVFECRYFGGLSGEDTAALLEVSTRTAQRDWDGAREWLAAALDPA